MRICRRCSVAKEDSEYYPAKGCVDGLNPTCKACISEKFKARYKDGKVDPDALYNKRLQQKFRITQALADRYRQGCVDCGNTNYTHLQWDHKDSVIKVLAFSKMWGRKDKDILAEVEKCELRCGNCHSVRTSKQFKWVNWMDVVNHPEQLEALKRGGHEERN